jgi:alpha-L-rhamnosidase
MFKGFFRNFLLLIINTSDVGCQGIIKDKDAVWISPVPSKDTSYGVYHFRNTFIIDELPDSLILQVSADNRYKLFINGKQIGIGPARGELNHWIYETYDIASFLNPGENVLSAQVWNAGNYRPFAQISDRTGFYLYCMDHNFSYLNTGSGNWRVLRDQAYYPIPFGIMDLGYYYVCGPGDSIVMSEYPRGWRNPDYDDANWGNPYQIPENETLWKLEKRAIPFMEMKPEPAPAIVRIAGDEELNTTKLPIRVPAESKVSVLLDQYWLTLGYPVLTLSEGKNSTIRITYAESLFDADGKKGNRNDINGKKIEGYYDIVIPDGSENVAFIPLWMRTFRFVQLDIQTEMEGLVIHDYHNISNSYPLTLDARFEIDDPLLEQIWKVGWRTLRLCMGETYFDCPYYEQLQYAGDTRVQMLITYALSKDDRLARNAIRQIWYSMQPEGITLSRYPSFVDQKIPGFSLYWISMLHDFMMYKNDTDWLHQFLPDVDSILSFFSQFVNEKNLIGPMEYGDTIGGLPEYWYFFDWSGGFYQGIPQGVYNNNSSVITLHYAYTLYQAAEIMSFFAEGELAEKYINLAEKLKKGVMEHCYDPVRGLIAQTPDKKLFSQHANILGVLTNAFPPEIQSAIIQKIVDDKTLIRCSMYYQFYLRRAMDKAGLGDWFLNMLGDWYTALKDGLNTFPEEEENSRSDCHAWNSSPCYEFFTTIAGIEPASPGFKTVSIRPHFGKVNKIYAKMPHPDGFILEVLEKKEGTIIGTVELPAGVKGKIYWAGNAIELLPGQQVIKF